MENVNQVKSVFPALPNKGYIAKICKRVLNAGHIKPGENVLVVADTAGSQGVIDTFINVAHSMDIPAQLMVTPYDPTAYDIYNYYSYTPPKPLVAAMTSADVIYALTIGLLGSWYSYHYYPSKVLSTGRVMFMKAMEDYIMRVAGPTVNLDDILEKGKKLQRKFQGKNQIKLTSPNGTNVIINSLRHSCDYYVPGEVFKAGEEGALAGGNYYIQFEKESVNGTIVLDGGMKMFGVLREPIKLTVKNDLITKIEGGTQAQQFKQYIEKLNDPNFPYLVHIGFGLNTGAETSWNGSECESVKGAVIWGIGRQENFFETKEHLYPHKKGLTAKNHFNPTTLKGTLWLDDELLLKDGKYVPHELN